MFFQTNNVRKRGDLCVCVCLCAPVLIEITLPTAHSRVTKRKDLILFEKELIFQCKVVDTLTSISYYMAAEYFKVLTIL